jgi:hypothetical protein
MKAHRTMSTPRPPLESLMARIRGEYWEMPGLRLTVAQACRLWQVDVPTSEMLLEQLMREGFLHKTGNGSYVAVSSTWSPQAPLPYSA